MIAVQLEISKMGYLMMMSFYVVVLALMLAGFVWVGYGMYDYSYGSLP